MKIGVLSPRSGWHFQDLCRAASLLDLPVQVRAVDFQQLSTQVCSRSKERSFESLRTIDAFDCLLIRTMPAGSLQQIVFRMDVLHRIAAGSVSVVNSPRSVEIAIDKYLSLSLMAAAGIPVPPFAVCQTVPEGMAYFRDLGGDVILKPIFGSMGKEVYRLRESSLAEATMQRFVDRGEVLYLQSFVHHRGSDIRILVVGDRHWAMRRHCDPEGWLTNVAQGGTATQHHATQAELNLARAAARINGCSIAGVDLIYGPNGDEPMVLEVNAAPGWQAISEVCQTDIAKEILLYLIAL